MDKILAIYKCWAESIVGDTVELDWSKEFECIPDDDPYRVWIGIIIPTHSLTELPLFFRSSFSCRIAIERLQIYTLCFLHEIGHIMTDWEFSDSEKEVPDDISTWDYHFLPHEFAASDWAMNYINENGRSVLHWQRRLELAYAAVSNEEVGEYIANRKEPL